MKTMIYPKNFKLYDSVLIFLGGVLLFTLGLNNQEIISFESRFYLFAMEMWRHGLTAFPMTYHQPYPDYPVTSTLLIYLAAKLFGGVTKFTAVLPSAIASALTLVVTYHIGGLHSRQWGISAVLFLLITLAFLAEARTISIDQYVTLITASCFYVMYSAKLFQSETRLYFLPLLLILGFIFRGPIGLVIPAGIICVFYLIEKDYKKFFLLGLSAAFLLAASMMCFLILAYYSGGMELVQRVIELEVLGRMTQAAAPPVYFYFIKNWGDYAITFPLLGLVVLPFVLMKCYQKKITPEIKFLLHLLGWIFIVVIGLSIPGDKKIRYVLPMAPALALSCAYFFSGEWQGIKKKFFYVLCAVVVIFVAVYILVAEQLNLKLNRTRDFVLQVEKIRLKDHAQLVFYRVDPDGLAIKYLISMLNEQQPIFIDHLDDLKRIHSAAVIIAHHEDDMRLPILLRGWIGRDPVSVSKIAVRHSA